MQVPLETGRIGTPWRAFTIYTGKDETNDEKGDHDKNVQTFTQRHKNC